MRVKSFSRCMLHFIRMYFQQLWSGYFPKKLKSICNYFTRWLTHTIRTKMCAPSLILTKVYKFK